MFIKRTLISSLIFASFFSNASPERCDFDNVSGETFEFSQPLTILLRDDVVDITDKGNYPFWYKSANTDEPLKVSEYFGRLAKVQSSQPVKRVSENTFKDVRQRLYVSYYSAIADNCEQVYVRVIENEFPQYYSDDIDFVDYEFDFLEQEKWLGISMIDNIKSLETREITHVTVRPEGAGRVVFINELGSDYSKLDRYETLEVLDVKRVPIYLYGKMLSNYGIKVKYKGEEGYINADYRFIFNGNPLLKVRDEYVNAVASGKLSFGMTKGDVLLTLGMPQSTEVYNVYESHQGYVTDYSGKYEGKGMRKVGEISHWNYPEIDYPLIFSMEGFLEESKQRFSRFDPMGLPNFMFGGK